MRTVLTRAIACTITLAIAACGKQQAAQPVAPAATAAPAPAGGEATAQKWIDAEFQPSTLSKEQQAAELKWFVEAAAKLGARGVARIAVVSETLPIHDYESKILAKAFGEMTGITVEHALVAPHDLAEKLQASMQSGQSSYDGWISDADWIGTHYRYGKILALSDYMDGEGKEFTNPGLDLKDFIGKRFTTAPDGKLYQLPDQQSARLYWFRADLFARDDLKARFKAKTGYDLGVPLNWSAYEDIAAFFTHDVKEVDGKAVYGHVDHGKNDPSLGRRFTDAWLSIAGAADIGIPNGLPVDAWGIRAGDDKCTPVGASISRGGATNSPAAVYALTQYVDWMKKYAPKEAIGMSAGDAGRLPASGQIAQQIFWTTAFTADLVKTGLPVVNPNGTPKWRVAPGPNGPYWKPGMQSGHQGVGAWTFFKNHDANKLAAAWLYAQFITARTTSLKKTLVGLNPIRESDIQSQAMTDMAPRLGGLVEFYRSPARVAWAPTGGNVPDHFKLAPLWGKNVAAAVSGEKAPQAAMDALAEEIDQVLERLERADMVNCPPRLNAKGDPAKWLSDKGAPWKKLANEKPKGETIAYEALLDAWKAGKVR